MCHAYVSSDPGMDEALHETALYQGTVRPDAGLMYQPDQSTVLRFRHLLEMHPQAEVTLRRVNNNPELRGLLFKQGSAVDATLMAAASSTAHCTRQRDPGMVNCDESEPSTAKKRNLRHFMRCPSSRSLLGTATRRLPLRALTADGIKAQVGLDAVSGLVNRVVRTAVHVHHVIQAWSLLHGRERQVYADVG